MEIVVSEINTQSDPKKTWNKIHSLKGISRDKKIYLVENNNLITDAQAVADKLANSFFDNSSDENYDSEFLRKNKEEKIVLTQRTYVRTIIAIKHSSTQQ